MKKAPAFEPKFLAFFHLTAGVSIAVRLISRSFDEFLKRQNELRQSKQIKF